MDRVTAYINSGSKRVHGWLPPLAAQAIIALARHQSAAGISGPVCEIGVHHGKLFVLLQLLTTPPETAVAWDLFERQDENIDRSGHGDREILERNLQNCGCDMHHIRINTANSLELTPEIILRECGGRPRLFSIDGGHTREITRNDLSLAERSLCEGGLIVLDDFFNEAWPGVAEGTCQYFFEEQTRLLPIAITGNKFFLTNDADAARRYMDVIMQMQWPWCTVNRSEAFGHEVVTVIPRTRTLRARLTSTPVWHLIRRTPAGRVIRMMAGNA